MKKLILVVVTLMMLGLAACSTATPTPETAPPGVPTVSPPTAEPTPDDGNPAVFLAIITPKNGTAWESTDFIDVTGSARAMPNDEVIVFFVDEGRNIYGSACADLGPANANNIKTYQTSMTAPVNTTTAGKVIAVVMNDDGSLAGSAGVFTTANPDRNDQHITIEEPGNRCVITNPSSFTVEGSGQGAFENNVVVQAQDASGKVLAEQVATYSSSADGGPGAWSVTFSVNVATGTEGRLVAFSTDPAGGSPLTSQTYTVFYGK